MTTAMGVYLGENLWRSFACGDESFTQLSELYSFSAIPIQSQDFAVPTMSEFLREYTREENPDSEWRAARMYQELSSWFERDWLTFQAADELVSDGFKDFQHIAPGKMPAHRALLTLLIFHPHRLHSNWVKRLWHETLAKHDGDSIAAEVELSFLCEQGQNDHLFTVPKPHETH